MPKQIPSKRRWMVTTALGWAIPVSILFWTMLWRYDGLTIGTALGVLAIAVALGFAFASVLCEILKKKYGIFKDD
jgi:ABC-type Fe3+ transport system permease subunit